MESLYGALRYIKNIEINRSTGELKEAAKGKPYVDMEKFIENEKYDGYYCILTNLFDEDSSGTFSDDKIIDMYRLLRTTNRKGPRCRWHGDQKNA